MRLIVDMNSLLNAALLGGKDDDEGKVITTEDGKKVQVNSAQYGIDRFADRISEVCTGFNAAPRDMVMVLDGNNAKARRVDVLSTYKEGRSKVPDVSDQINIARKACTQMMLDLGSQVVQQAGFEADDVIGYLCKTLRSERNTVVTSDGDLTVLVDENTDVWRLGKLNENPYGPFPHKYITLYKALVGDPSDRIPGAKGFGDAAWCDLVRVFQFDGLDLMIDLIKSKKLSDLAEDVGELKSLQRIIDSQAEVTKSWIVANLHWEDVNTGLYPMHVQAGMVKQWTGSDDQHLALKRFYGTSTLVTANNYAAIYERLAQTRFKGSPFVALDIETASSEKSDEWLEQVKYKTESAKERIDVLGHELCGMSLTFGDNTQHTIYLSVDHKDTDNITVDQCREMCELIPQSLHIVIQNRQFEFSVLYRTWGEKWKDNGWHGFVPNALDSAVAASYVDENIKRGLKLRSQTHLGYTQQTYEQTTSKSGPVGTLKGGQITKTFKHEVVPAVYEPVAVEMTNMETGEIVTEYENGKLLEPAVTEDWETHQYKMNQLTAKEVFAYGCDDTLCTAALMTYYKFVMDVENTWDVFLKVETLPEYLTSLAFVHGIEIDKPRLHELEKKDDESYDAAWKLLRSFLMKKGWDGTYCPEFEGSIEASDAKMAVELLLDDQFATRKRKLNGIAEDIRTQYPDNALATVLAQTVEDGSVERLNKLLKANFTGEPKINFGSPKQIQNLFYNVIGIPIRIVNQMTEKQRENEDMASAFKKFKCAKKTDTIADYTKEEHTALMSKASTDDTTVDTALAMDDLSDEVEGVLKAYKTIKGVQTRRNLFYKTYKALPHWRDGRIHPSLNQAQAVTRRWSSSEPNIQQLPKRSEVPFRQILLPHHKDAVVISMDFSSQEIRLLCDYCRDESLTACYIGDNLKDVHSMTAVSAAIYLWGHEVEYEDFIAQLDSDDPKVKKAAKTLRSQAKTVVFSSQYDCQAPNLAQQLMVSESIAQQFLDAKSAAFPKVDTWKEQVRESVAKLGFATTKLGARRHLASASNSDDRWESSRAERQGPNFKIQGSGREQLALAMASMWQRGLFQGKYDAVPYAPVHDEFVASVHRRDALQFMREMHACMVQPYADMHIPIVSSVSLGPNFGDQRELGTSVIDEVVNKSLEELFHNNTTKETN